MNLENVREEYTKTLLEIGKLSLSKAKLEAVLSQLAAAHNKAAELEALYLKLEKEVAVEASPTHQE